MENKIKILITLVTLTQATACVTTIDANSRPGSFSPKPLFLRNLPQGDDSYSLGFRDGCYNIIGQVGFGLMRVYDKAPEPDSDLIADQFYQQGYRHGDRYCSVYTNNGIIL